jgi:hypothetical protein
MPYNASIGGMRRFAVGVCSFLVVMSNEMGEVRRFILKGDRWPSGMYQ